MDGYCPKVVVYGAKDDSGHGEAWPPRTLMHSSEAPEKTDCIVSSRLALLQTPCGRPEPSSVLTPVRVNRKRLREMFSTGVAELESVFQSILSPSTLAELQRIARTGKEEEFDYPAELWVRTVYEFAASYQKSVINRDHIIQAFAPLLRGRMFTFLMENRNASADDVENNIEGLCLEFERLKPYLLQMWKSRE